MTILRSLWKHRDLLVAWTEREIKIRYKQSVVGSLWAILQPLSLMIMFTVIFSYWARVTTNGIPYPLFSYVALLPWTLFATSITFAVPSLVNNISLVTKVYFPREILPIASVLAALLDFGIASTIFLALSLFYQFQLSWTIVFVIPLLVLQLLLTVGIVLFLSAVNVFFRDIRFVIPIAVQLLMYASPIIYPISMVPDDWRLVYMLNPLAGLIDAYRSVVLAGEFPNMVFIGYSAIMSIGVFVLGYTYFKRQEPNFADLI
ncbi:MAG: ABC transporter permease [Chloroflexi bacterium]|nr:ABC transporter permease [Chloroflexota bacterium]